MSVLLFHLEPALKDFPAQNHVLTRLVEESAGWATVLAGSILVP